MTVFVGSMWRDSARYIDRSLDQFKRLADELDAVGKDVRFGWVESSSDDDTYDRLASSGLPHDLVKMDDGCPFFPSKDDRRRWRHLAWLSNGVLDLAGDADEVLYVESDLAWEPSDMVRLLGHLERVEVVSALNVHHTGVYYDVWGSVGMDGRRFRFGEPFHPSLDTDAELVEVQSMAGCTALLADVAKMCRFSPDDCYRGWNREMRLAGFKVWCDPEVRVIHD